MNGFHQTSSRNERPADSAKPRAIGKTVAFPTTRATEMSVLPTSNKFAASTEARGDSQMSCWNCKLTGHLSLEIVLRAEKPPRVMGA